MNWFIKVACTAFAAAVMYGGRFIYSINEKVEKINGNKA